MGRPTIVGPADTSLHDQMRANLAPARAFARILAGHSAQADGLVRDAFCLVSAMPNTTWRGAALQTRVFATLHALHYASAMRGDTANPTSGDDHMEPGCSTRPRDQVVFSRAFWRLADHEREVLVLVGASGLSSAEVAQVCHCSASVVADRNARARAVLWRALGERHVSRSAGAAIAVMWAAPSHL